MTAIELLLYPLRQWAAGGPLLVPIALVCVAIWAFFLNSRRVLRQTAQDGRRLESALRDEPASWAAVASGAGGVLGPALRRVNEDVADGMRPLKAFEREERIELSRMKRDLVVLAALTAVAPLLGLLGTVVGMIETFQAVARTTGGTAARVASGVSKALITTQFGLTVAIPGVFGVARIRRLTRDAGIVFEAIRVRIVPLLERSAGG